MTELSQSDLDYIRSVRESGEDLYRAYDRIIEVVGNDLTNDQRFWFEQASIVNRQANGIPPDPTNNQSATFILSYTDYGLEIDGQSANLQSISNNIADTVIRDVLDRGGIPSLDTILTNDISAALSQGGQTIGGWGGSFYYWDLEYTVDTNDNPVTVGEAILSNGVEFEKFMISAVVAAIATASQNELDGGQTWSEWFEEKMAGVNADAPLWIKLEILDRIGIAEETGELTTHPSRAALAPSYRDASGQRWSYAEGDDQFYDALTGEIASGNVEKFLRERMQARESIDAAGLGSIAQALAFIGRADLIPEQFHCFVAGTMINMWPTDPSIRPDANGLYDEAEVCAKMWQKPIKEITPDDTVVSFDNNGHLKPGRVTRKFTNKSKIILDFFGTGVTPGHVYYRVDSAKTHRFEALIDILQDDGIVQRQDGTHIRAATGVPIGDPRDRFVWAVAGTATTGGAVVVSDKGKLRLGTRFITDDGRDLCIADLIDARGGIVTDDGLVRAGDAHLPFHWAFSRTLPKPQDYVLKRSGTTLADIYAAAEGEGQYLLSHGPAPSARTDRGPTQPRSEAVRHGVPHGKPLAANGEGAAAAPGPVLNRKQRRAMEAKSAKKGSRKRITVH